MNINIPLLYVSIAKSCLTMKELSSLSGVNITTLSRVYCGKQIPSPKTIGKIAKALNINVEDLIETKAI